MSWAPTFYLNEEPDLTGKLTVEKAEYNKFIDKWLLGDYRYLRLGQAFYNHFHLHSLSNQDQLKNLYERDGTEALNLIHQIFIFH